MQSFALEGQGFSPGLGETGGFEWAEYIPVEEGRSTEVMDDNPVGSVAGVISAER